MATKRMFSNVTIDSDLFLELPPMAQLLYFHCGMKTDDDGFVSGAKRIGKIIGAKDDDFKSLINSGFLIEFPDSKVFVVVHHRQNNDLKNDRYHPTNFQKEFRQLLLTENKVYQIKDTDCFQDVSEMDTEQNVTHRNPTQRNPKNVTNGNGAEGSDEGGSIPALVKADAVAQGIAIQKASAMIEEFGSDTVHHAVTIWKEDKTQSLDSIIKDLTGKE